MKKVVLFLMILFSLHSYSQENENIEDNNIYSSAGIEVQPEYPGGYKAFAEYLSKNYKLPNVKGLNGKVFVEFVVEKDGHLDNIKVIRDVGYGTGNEAIRVLKECSFWKPAMQNGKLIRVKFSLPINIDVK